MKTRKMPEFVTVQILSRGLRARTVARILRTLADRIEADPLLIACRIDYNGSVRGSYGPGRK